MRNLFFSFQDVILSAAAAFHFRIRSKKFIINLAAGKIHISVPSSVFLVSFFSVSSSISFLCIPK